MSRRAFIATRDCLSIDVEGVQFTPTPKLITDSRLLAKLAGHPRLEFTFKDEPDVLPAMAPAPEPEAVPEPDLSQPVVNESWTPVSSDSDGVAPTAKPQGKGKVKGKGK